MKSNRLTIRISRPVAEVYAFTLDPKNTPQWIDFVDHETTNEWPAKVGTIYEHHSKTGHKSVFILTDLKEDASFELRSDASDYFVRYTFTSLENNSTEFEYYEWVSEGDLDEPFTINILEKLKAVMESQ